MIDFQKSVLFKLDPIPVAQILDPINKFLIDGETVLSAFKMVRDQLVFTNKRIIAANVQGLVGKKIDYTSPDRLQLTERFQWVPLQPCNVDLPSTTARCRISPNYD
jgi:hypothetical protein